MRVLKLSLIYEEKQQNVPTVYKQLQHEMRREVI
ncbi:hypothetical protein EV294_101465 [Paenibacillus sp. BK033]|nr:hypothetical protein [Paenibacillus sp. BK720]TCN01013.1 hypothetical protein EV294_101465 [Paenibacillus sp. BK033]